MYGGQWARTGSRLVDAHLEPTGRPGFLPEQHPDPRTRPLGRRPQHQLHGTGTLRRMVRRPIWLSGHRRPRNPQLPSSSPPPSPPRKVAGLTVAGSVCLTARELRQSPASATGESKHNGPRKPGGFRGPCYWSAIQSELHSDECLLLLVALSGLLLFFGRRSSRSWLATSCRCCLQPTTPQPQPLLFTSPPQLEQPQLFFSQPQLLASQPQLLVSQPQAG